MNIILVFCIGIPTLVLLDEKGEIITMNGRGAMQMDEDCTVCL